MSAAVHVARVKRACLAVRRTVGQEIVGTAVALEVGGRAVLATDASTHELLVSDQAQLASGRTPLLGLDAEGDVAILAVPPGSDLQPLDRLALAPLGDGDALLVTGFALLARAGVRTRTVWITRTTAVAGHVHLLAEGEQQPEFRYLLDLPPGAVAAGSPIYRPADGALAGFVAGGDPDVPGLASARPIRDVVAFIERIPAARGAGSAGAGAP